MLYVHYYCENVHYKLGLAQNSVHYKLGLAQDNVHYQSGLGILCTLSSLLFAFQNRVSLKGFNKLQNYSELTQ